MALDAPELWDLELLLDDDDDAPSTSRSAFLASTRDFTPETTTPKTRLRIRESSSQEIAYLQSKQRYLLRQLELLRDKHTSPAGTGVWQARAIQQAQAAERAKRENTRLRALVHDQLELARGMERMLLKRPKLSVFPSVVAHGVLGCDHRATDLRMLLQHDYGAIDSDYIRFGLHDMTARGTSTRKTFVETTVDDKLDLHFIQFGSAPFDYATMSNLLWQHMTTKLGPSTECLLLEAPDLAYTKELVTLDDVTMPVLEVRTASRCYDHDGRIVVVCRSIVEDALLPHAEGHLTDARHGWTVIEPKSPTECHILMHLTLPTPIFPENSHRREPVVGTWTELLLRAMHEQAQTLSASIVASAAAQQPIETAD